MRHTSRSIVVLVLLLGCGSPPKDTHRSMDPTSNVVPPLPKPWTERFQQPGLIVADEVRIEGPDGLLDHIATRIDPESHVRNEKTTPQGFLTTIEQRPNAAPLEIKIFLDRTEIVALRKVVMLERPGPVDVVLSASGDVLWKDLRTQAESRKPALRLEGKIPR